jgi:PAS domain S-box-containing protein
MGDSTDPPASAPPPLPDEALPLQLEAAEERLRVVLGLTESIVFEVDKEGRYLAVFTRSDGMLAVPREAVLGRTVTEVIGPQIGVPFLACIQRVLSKGEAEHFEYSLDMPGGRRWFSADALPVPQRASVACLVRDITQQKTLELRLLQADRLAALGTLAAGVAHEVSNPLGYISSNLNFIAEGLAEMRQALGGAKGPPDLAWLERTLEECVEALTEAQQGTTRIRDVVGDLKTFARGEDPGACEGQADVRRALETSINMALPELRSRARLVRHLADVPPALGNESRLGQVFLNLLLNAAQAIPEGAPEKNTVEAHLRAEGDKVVIEIRDTGQGIPPENLERIFDPFFTTRPVGVGTGLGLAICHGIVTGMKGEISVASTVGQGTCFRILLPAATDDGTPTPG